MFSAHRGYQADDPFLLLQFDGQIKAPVYLERLASVLLVDVVLDIGFCGFDLWRCPGHGRMSDEG
jgi:hypothetical protein